MVEELLWRLVVSLEVVLEELVFREVVKAS